MNTINPNDPAFPINIGTGKYTGMSVIDGMSIRTEIAKCAMQGLLSNPVHSQKLTFTLWQRIKRIFGWKYKMTSSFGDNIPKIAVFLANQLIEELNK